MPPNLPLPRGWKRRVRMSVLDQLDSTIHVPFFKRRKSVAQYKPYRFCIGCAGPAILDTADPLYNPHYLVALGSPRTPNQRKFSEAPVHRQILLPRAASAVSTSALSVTIGSPSETLNAQPKQRPVTGSGQAPCRLVGRSSSRYARLNLRSPSSGFLASRKSSTIAVNSLPDSTKILSIYGRP